jgi:phage-related protein
MSDGKLLFETALDTKGFTTGLDTVKKTATSAFSVSTKAVTAITGAMAAGLTAATTQSVKAYADYEQLVGGVETLFKESKSTVLEYANIAYKTAGLSANAYMDTVTSFSASLLQSLDGDTAAAATKADRAITDMADNANKMGTNMRDIQNAYQGFAKQNYTMLDNLKLGYGGTKEEMERLIATANEINAQQGIATSYSIDSFADIVDAIHVVQENLDITGTTAKEASTTIQGSIASLGAAWENFLTGMADPDQDFDTLLNNLIDSALTAADNLIPRIVETTPRLVDGLSQIATNLSGYLPGILQELLPSILDGTQALLDSVSAALPDLIGMAVDIAPQMIDFAVQLIGALAQGIIDNLPQLLTAAEEIADTILDGIGDLCPALDPITDAIKVLLDNLDKIIPVVISLTAAFVAWKIAISIVGLINGVKAAMEGLTLAEKAAELAQKLLNATMLANPFVLIVTLIAGLVAAFIYFWNTSDSFRQFWIDLWEKIRSAASDVIDAIVGFFTETIPNAVDGFVDFIKNNWQTLLMLLNPATLLAGIFKLVYDNCDAFREFVDGFIENIKNAVTNAWDLLVQWVSELPETIMYWLGFILTSLILWGQDLINWATTAIPEFAETIVTFFSELPEKIAAFFGKILADLAVWASNMVAKAVETGTNFRDSIVTFFSQLPERIATLLGKVIGRILSFAAKMRERASDAGKGFFDNIVAALKDLPSRMSEIGKHIVDGIWTGISGGWDWLTGQVKNLANSLFQGAKDALEIHSPSKKFKWLGEMCVEGMDAPLADYNPYETLKDSMDAGVIRPELFAGAAVTQPGDAVRNTAGGRHQL